MVCTLLVDTIKAPFTTKKHMLSFLSIKYGPSWYLQRGNWCHLHSWPEYKAGIWVIVQRDGPTLQSQPTDTGHSRSPVDPGINEGSFGWKEVLPISSSKQDSGRGQKIALNPPSRSWEPRPRGQGDKHMSRGYGILRCSLDRRLTGGWGTGVQVWSNKGLW